MLEFKPSFRFHLLCPYYSAGSSSLYLPGPGPSFSSAAPYIQTNAQNYQRHAPPLT